MEPNANPMLIQMFPLVIILFIFYFIIIRPQKKKQKEHQEMIANLKKNDEVVTNGGIHGTIVNVKEATFVLRVDENVKIEIDKGVISYVKKTRE